MVFTFQIKFKKINNMDIDTINAKIAVKQKQIQVEVDPDRKRKLQDKLQELNLMKDIEEIRRRIEQIRNR